MSVINNGILLGADADAAVGYQVSRSLRFNAPDSAYLSRTPGSAGDRNKWTFSCWVKLGAGLANNIFSVFTANSGNTGLIIRSGSIGSPYQIELFTQSGATVPLDLITTRVFRDYGAWFHLLFYFDLANSTQADRAQIYINGVRETNFSTNTNTISTSSVGRDINNTSEHRIGAGNGYADGYLADVHFCDGYAYDPSYFTETDAITGQLIPKAFTGSYGTNGFRLTFSDNSGTTATTLGKDAAGSNNWTPSGFSVASGAGNDSLVDSPTGYGTDTGAGGEVRGNYATINPLQNAGGDTFSNGNLQVASSASNYGTHTSTIATPLSGKWYAEVTIGSASPYSAVGLVSASSNFTTTSWTGSLNGVAYYGNNGNKYVDASSSSYGASFGNGDVIGIAYDADNGTVAFYKNGTSQGTISSVTVRSYYFGGSDFDTGSSVTYNWNFGQRSWAYAPPSGYKALCSHNLPEPTILKGNTAMDVKLYTGNGSGQTISGLGFSPDLVWIKNRADAEVHGLFDVVRGADNWLSSNTTDAETNYGGGFGVTSFTSDGFAVGTGTAINANGKAIVAWNWDCGSSTVTNTSGSISSQVRASATNGCSVVTYTGTGSAATVGHGCGAAPSLIITKRRNSTSNWGVYHRSIGATKYLLLNTTDAEQTSIAPWNDTAPTSTVFSVRDATFSNESASFTYVAYCFAPVAGFSAFGSFVTNGADDNAFVFTGFRPRWVMWKRTDGANAWGIVDSARSSYNVIGNYLLANASDAEANSTLCDLLSNGFKMRTSGFGNGQTFVYAAFAESPFKYSRAR